MKDEILKQLAELLDENTIAFFSVTLTKRKDGDIFPTFTHFGGDQSNYETRLWISDAIIYLARKMRERE